MGHGNQNRLTFLFCFRDDISNFCSMAVENIFNDDTAQNVDAFKCYFGLMFCNGGRAQLRGRKRSMEMYASWNAYQ